MARERGRPKFPRHGGEQEHGLHHGKRRSETLPRTGAEREIGEARQVPRRNGAPTARVELIRIGEEPGIAMHDPLAHDDIGAAGNAIAAEFESVDGGAGHGPRPIRRLTFVSLCGARVFE